MNTPATPPTPGATPKGHPPGLYLLFAVEMWERFSYYGMKAFLMIYMTTAMVAGGLEWNKERAGGLYGWYTGLAYLTPIMGGYIADRFIGTHYSMLIGGAVIAAGHFTLAFETIPSFYAGLGLIIIGTGFFKPCVSVMVSQLYPAKDVRRDAAFTIFYMGINLGAFLGPIVCGGLRVGRKQGEVYGWDWAFAAAGVGMVLGLIAYLVGRPFFLKGIGLPTRGKSAPLLAEDMQCAKCSHSLAGLDRDTNCPECGLSTADVPAERRPLTRKDKEGIAAIFILSFFVIFFWTAFEQSGSSMTIFAEERTDRSISTGLAQQIYAVGTEAGNPLPTWVFILLGAALVAGWIFFERLWKKTAATRSTSARLAPIAARIIGLAVGPVLLLFGVLKMTGFLKEAFLPDDFVAKAEYPADWFQSVNPFFILLFAPIFAAIWLRLARKGREPSTPLKFSLGLMLLGAGFVFMVLGGQASSGPGDTIVKVSGLYLLGAYCIHTMAELCVSPVGLSVVNKLSPVRFVTLLMGVWFLANFIANKVAGTLAGMVDKIAKEKLSIGGFDLEGQALFFSLFVVAPVLAGVVLLFLVPKLSKLMHGRA